MDKAGETDDRVPFAKAYGRVSYVVSIALEMVIPGALGYWVDHYLGTKFLFAVLGFAFGLTYGVWQLVRLGNAELSRNVRHLEAKNKHGRLQDDVTRTPPHTDGSD